MVTENSPESIPIPSKFENKKLIFILFLIFGLLFLAIGFFIGYLYGHKQISVPVTPSIPSSTLPTVVPTVIPTSVSTSVPTQTPTPVGKMYRDGVYKFEFEYPTGYHILEDFLSTNKYTVPKDEESPTHALWIVREKYKNISQNPGIELFLVSTSKTIEEYLQARQEKLKTSWQELLAGFPSGTYQDAQEPAIISTNDYQGKFISAKQTVEKSAPNAPFQDLVRFYFKKGDILFILSARYDERDGIEESLIDKETVTKIFNTFKFF